MQHEAARPKGRSFDDEPTSQPMRPAARGQIARNPSTDQKRVRRANTMKKSADWTPGHVNCRSCGFTGHPMMSGGATGPECSHCGSYEVSKTRPTPTGGTPYPENSRYLHQGDYALTGPSNQERHAAKTANAYDPGSVSDECLDDGQGCDGGDCDCGCHRGGMNTAEEVKAYHADDPHSYYKLLRDQHGDWDEHHQRRSAAKVATVLDTRAEMLNPGDQIKAPNGRTMKVQRVRPHETSGKHVYVDTDGGTTVVERSAGFQVVPRNSQQQSLPGYGTPGGNANHLPFDPQSGNSSNQAPSNKCPNCGGPGTLARQGDHYACSRCGYKEQFGGAGGHAFSDATQVVRTFSTVNSSTKSAVARRAEAMLNQKETQ